MAVHTLKAVARTQGAIAAVKDGSVAPDDVAFEFEEVSPLPKAFRRMVRELAFDVCEMAFTTYLCAKEHGKPFTALPVFLVRDFHHGAVVRRSDGPVRHPKDLEGQRVAVNRGYTVTTGVWARGILADEHGIDLSRVTWVTTGADHVAEYEPPPNVVAADEGASPADLLAAGDVAAAVGIRADAADLVPVIDDPDEAALAALRREGLYPINHLVVVRDDLLGAHPGLAAGVFRAFAEAKRGYVERLRSGAVGEPTAGDRLLERVMTVLDDPLPYGIEPNRAMIDKLLDYAVDQQILRRRPAVAELFAPGTHELVA
jgi:4,5-dihydroxyphthalate decarboxylase